MTVRQLLDRLFSITTKPSEPARAGYRDPAPVGAADALRDLESHMAAQRLRIRVLERQLVADGRVPCTTPSLHELRAVVDVLDALARLDYPRLNTLELRALADSMRGLATWGLGES